MNQLLASTEDLVRNISQSIIPIATRLPSEYKDIKENSELPSLIKIGDLLNKHNKGVSFPALIPLKDLNGLAFKLNDTNREEIHLALQHFAFQIVSNSPKGHVSLTIMDAKKMGANFRLMRKLNKNILQNFAADEESQKTALELHCQKSISVISECLTHYKDLAQYNQTSGHVQPFRILLIADFPHGFRENLDKLNTLLMNANEAGIFVFLTYDQSAINRSNEDKIKSILSHCYKLEEYDTINDYYHIAKDGIALDFLCNDNYILKLDPEHRDTDHLMTHLDALNLEHNIDMEQDQIDGIRIPIGTTMGQKFYFTFGFDSDNYHAIIGGQSGKGKSVLLNNIIARGIETYSPDELRFIIIDCGGTGYQEFNHAPHMQVLRRTSNVEECYNIVQTIEQELTRREKLFGEYAVADLKQYVRKTGYPLPRLFCIIDEFHILYTGKEKFSSYFDAILVDRVIRIGRKFGIHLIACTQSLGGGVRRSILDNIPLRIALGMTTDQSQGFLGMRNDAASNLERGVAVYNSQNGNLQANKVVKVNFIEEKELENIIERSTTLNTNYERFERIIG